MIRKNLAKHIALEHTHAHVHIDFDIPHRVVSSAVLNGGFVEADNIVNVKVEGHSDTKQKMLDLPEAALANYCLKQDWQGKIVGMMTAASMDSLRVVRTAEQGVEIIVLVTSGLSNPRRAGDRAEYREISHSATHTGTINIICLTTATLTDAAMIEAVSMAAEAKSAALQNLGVLSPVSNDLATGTGTDAIAIASGYGPQEVRYCGKHVLFGEMLACSVIEGISSSVHWELENERKH